MFDPHSPRAAGALATGLGAAGAGWRWHGQLQGLRFRGSAAALSRPRQFAPTCRYRWDLCERWNTSAVSDEQQLRAKAAKRWRWRFVLPGLVGGVVGPMFGDFLFHDHQRRTDSPLSSIAGALVGVAVVIGIMFLITRRNPRILAGDGWFSAPLSAGLGWRQRRAAARAVRRVQPSRDSLLRTVEQDLARRSIRQARRSVIFFSVLIIVCVLIAVLGNVTSAGRIYFLVGGVLFAFAAVWTAFFTRRAREYLEKSETSD